jgi:glycosyltransferase involved in cell wall biosynthesis
MTQRKQHITVLVSNDLEYDQRVAKVCDTLLALNFEITLIGRLLPESKSFERPYTIRRFRLPFRKGALFYAALNIRLFFYLLFCKTDLILANDLDTLLPAILVGRLRSKKIIYDSHEYFTEAEGLTGRPFQKNIWLRIEAFCFPKAHVVYTVNESIASIYRKRYNKNVGVVRNIPLLQANEVKADRRGLGLPEDKKIILLQGAFIDPDRGGKELVESMRFIDGCILLIIGSGRELPLLHALAKEPALQYKIIFKPKLAFQALRAYTACADIGVSLDKPLHLNYTLSLPNKLFDYIHGGIPVLVSNLPELRAIVEAYGVGEICDEVTPEEIARSIERMLASGVLNTYRLNCIKAREQLNWQKESLELHKMYAPFQK